MASEKDVLSSKSVELAPRKQPPDQRTKIIRQVSPLGMRVLLRVRKEENTTEAGLFLPEGSKESMEESVLGEVLEVASAVDADTQEEANISGIPFGALVLIQKKAGTKVPWDETLRIVDTKDILAVVNEMKMI